LEYVGALSKSILMFGTMVHDSLGSKSPTNAKKKGFVHLKQIYSLPFVFSQRTFQACDCLLGKGGAWST
jgi:hypothetical protein